MKHEGVVALRGLAAAEGGGGWHLNRRDERAIRACTPLRFIYGFGCSQGSHIDGVSAANEAKLEGVFALCLIPAC